MYSVGDKVVHPGYGPGIITAIERRQVIGEAKTYYVIDMLAGGGTLMTPVEQADTVGLRLAVSNSTLKRLLRSLTGTPKDLPTDFRERQLEVEERLTGSDLNAATAVIRDLAWYDQLHGMTKRDTQLMDRAEDLLASELALVEGIEVKAALQRVQDTVAEAVQQREAA
jgi:CarD family transcriptional regulator